MKLASHLHLTLRLIINGMNRGKCTFTYFDHVAINIDSVTKVYDMH